MKIYVILALALGALVAAVPGCRVDSIVVVETALGRIAGFRLTNGIHHFAGIPYAKAPVGALRFRPPLAVEPWTEIHPEFPPDSPLREAFFAFGHGPSCPQPDDQVPGGIGEDCLRLTIWTPGLDDARRPVLFWIHGGGWIYEDANYADYDGEALAARGDVVVVSVDYRLGAFGFLHLEEIAGSEYATSGTVGLQDQIAGLEWVRDHIANFGGDPDSVTIVGESAGGMSVTSLLAMPRARGLFHRAVAMSGAASTLRTAEYAADVTRRFMGHAGVEDVAGLQALPVEAMIAATRAVENEEYFGDLLFSPVIDGVSLPEPPLHAIAAGRGADVPLLHGTTRDEARLWAYYEPLFWFVTPEFGLNDVVPWLGETLAERLAAILDGFGYVPGAPRPGVITLDIATDVFFRIPHIRLSEARVGSSSATFMYLFTYPTPKDNGMLGAFHGIDVYFFFRSFGASFAQRLIGDDVPLSLSDATMDALLGFVRSGDPSHPGLPAWPAYELERRATMLLDETSTVVDDPLGERRLLWEGIAFDSVDPAIR